MKKRVELGVSPFPTGASADLPPHTHEEYEQAIREAGRRVGRLYLDQGDLAKAWGFFRMLGEPEPVREALERYRPGPEDEVYPVIDIAWQQGVLPKKGFDLLLDRHGICSAITMVGGADLSQNPDLQQYCVRRLVRSIYDQLRERLLGDIRERGEMVPDDVTVGQLVAGRDWLFGDDCYHVDVSHLSSVVQMSLNLPRCEELNLARELCDYGARLSPAFRGDADPPFENGYADYGVYLAVLAGDRVEEGLAHFRAKLEPAAADGDTYPAQVFVNLLLKLDRPAEALDVAKQYLAAEDRPMACPGVQELAHRVKDYATLAAAARERNDAVNFLAGLIAGSAMN
jgi:hypothetical protein